MFVGWIWYFLSSVVLGAVLAFCVGAFRKRLEWSYLKRFGGISIIIPVFLLVLFNPEMELTLAIKGLLMGLFLILIFGLADDVFNFSWRSQLIFQIFLAVLLIFVFDFRVDYFTGPFENPIRIDSFTFEFLGSTFSLLSLGFIFVWILSIINAVNWADGINGLSGMVGMLGGVALLWVSLMKEVNQPAIAILAIIFIGALLGFWWNNFPNGKIEAGTSGSYAIGFFLAITAIIAGTKVATTLIILTIPLVDSLYVICERFLNNSPITKKDKRHLHYKLRTMGWSDSKIVLVYFVFISITLVLSFLGDLRIWKLTVVFLEIVLLLFFIYKVSEKINVKSR